MQAISLPYLENAEKLSRLESLLDRPWAILLDSAGNESQFNSFDIFSCQPTVRLEFSGGQVEVESDLDLASIDAPSLDRKDPLSCMRQLLTLFKKMRRPYEQKLPFNGGWMGYISYDFARYLEKLPELAQDDIQLPEIQMGLYQWALISDHRAKTSTLYNFGLDESDWLAVVKLFDPLLKTEQKQATNSNEIDNFKLVQDWQSNTGPEQYQSAFEKIKNYINAGDCYQVNYAQRFSTRYQGSVKHAYKQLTTNNGAPFSAFLNFQTHQILSLSPERFIQSINGKVITQPIKGTRARSADPVEDKALAQSLKNSAKDRAENLMIVDLLRNDLSRTAANASVRVTELFAHHQFSSVHHLISTVESRLAPEYDNFDLLATTFPGGSITGAPKIRAMEIIEELEPVRRNLYCGIIGYLDFENNMDSNICIRTLIAKQNRLYCWAGGGLVADSQMQTEYQETFDKLAKILPILSPETGPSI